jgi:hypothetical protein
MKSIKKPQYCFSVMSLEKERRVMKRIEMGKDHLGSDHKMLST